jgi:hypothetical protein
MWATIFLVIWLLGQFRWLSCNKLDLWHTCNPRLSWYHDMSWHACDMTRQINKRGCRQAICVLEIRSTFEVMTSKTGNSRFTCKRLQSKRATASLLTKNNQFVWEKISILWSSSLDLWSIIKPQMLSGTIVISNSMKSVRLWGTALVQFVIKYTPTGTVSLPMQTAPSATALKVRFTYSLVANTLIWWIWGIRQVYW